MNRSELIEKVASTAGLERKQAEAAVSAFVDSVVTTAKSGEPVSIFGFGIFKPTARAARMGRNPQTNQAVKISASKSVKFQPATAFKAALNTRSTKKAAAPAKKTTAVGSPAKKAAAATKVATPAKSTATVAGKVPAAKKTAPAKKSAATTKKR